jgi:hypothetical protein
MNEKENISVSKVTSKKNREIHYLQKNLCILVYYSRLKKIYDDIVLFVLWLSFSLSCFQFYMNSQQYAYMFAQEIIRIHVKYQTIYNFILRQSIHWIHTYRVWLNNAWLPHLISLGIICWSNLNLVVSQIPINFAP